MIISTQRLMLVPLGSQFLQSTHRYASDYENARYMVHLPNSDLSETELFLKNVEDEWQKPEPEFYEFAILLGKDHIGGVCIYFNKDRSEGELGWIILKSAWGNGYAEEAAREIIRFAIEEQGVTKFVAHCDSENIASYRVMEKLGMTLQTRTLGRKNKFSDEDRVELKYFMGE